MHGVVRAQSLTSLEKPAETWIPVDTEIYLGCQLRSSKPEVGFFLTDKAKPGQYIFLHLSIGERKI